MCERTAVAVVLSAVVAGCAIATPAAIDAGPDAPAVDAGQIMSRLDAGPGMPPELGAIAGEVCSIDGWCWENPLPTGNTLSAVWAVAPTDVWIVGARGTVLHWNGATWTALPPPADVALREVWASGPDDVWTTSHHWNGSSWTLADHPGHHWGTAANDVWSVSDAIWHFDGRAWSLIGTPTATGITSVSGSAPDDVWFTPGYDGSGHADLRLFHWDGAALATITRPGAVRDGACDCNPTCDVCNSLARQVWSTSATDAWLATDSHISHWDGAAFHDVPPPDCATSWWSGEIWGTGPRDVWVLGHFNCNSTFGLSGQPALYRFDGTSWSITTPPAALHTGSPGAALSGLHGSGPSDAWLVGYGGTVAHWNGAAWAYALPRSIVPSSPDVFHGAWTDGTTIRAIGSTSGTSGMWRFDGHAWATEDVGASGVGIVSGSGPSDVWASTSAGLVRFDGHAWSPAPDPTIDAPITALWARAPDDAWAALQITQATAPTYSAEVLHWDGTHWAVWGPYVLPADSFSTGASVTAFGGTAVDDVWIATDVWYPTASAHVARWDGTTFADTASFSRWRHANPRIAIVAGARGEAWLAAYDRIVHVDGGAGDTTMYCPTPSAGLFCDDGDPETVMAREPGGRLWATRTAGSMLTFDGVAWTASITGTDARLHALAATADGNTRALGDSAAILRHSH